MARTLLIAALVLAGIVVGALFFRVDQPPHIQLPAEPVAGIGSFPITNSMLAGWISTIVVLLLFWRGTAAMRLAPAGLQNAIEMLVEFVLGLCENIAGRERGRRFFPFVATIFFFLLVSNWMGLLPGYGTIEAKEWHPPGYSAETPAGEKGPVGTVKPTPEAGAKPTAAEKTAEPSAAGEHATEHRVPLLRAASSDLNTTLAIALVSVFMTQVFGLRVLGGEYLQRFFNFKGGPIGFYVGVLEFIAEMAKIISFTFRLFGNIFAGEVLLAVMVFLLPWVVVLPFIGLELFVGFIQAFVFAILTLVFMSLATTSHEHHDPHAEHSGAHGPAQPQPGAAHH
ncbi:MAG TPA: F0F1 ATP synthase subunit A [Chloroflexota bacterium]